MKNFNTYITEKLVDAKLSDGQLASHFFDMLKNFDDAAVDTEKDAKLVIAYLQSIGYKKIPSKHSYIDIVLSKQISDEKDIYIEKYEDGAVGFSWQAFRNDY